MRPLPPDILPFGLPLMALLLRDLDALVDRWSALPVPLRLSTATTLHRAATALRGVLTIPDVANTRGLAASQLAGLMGGGDPTPWRPEAFLYYPRRPPTSALQGGHLTAAQRTTLLTAWATGSALRRRPGRPAVGTHHRLCCDLHDVGLLTPEGRITALGREVVLRCFDDSA